MTNVRSGIKNWLRFCGLVLVLTLAAPSALALTGDLDGSGQIDLLDAQSALRVAAGIAPESSEVLQNGDVFPPGHPDGRLDLRDVRTLLIAIVSVGGKLDMPLFAAYLSSDPDVSLSNILAIVTYSGPFSSELFLGYPKGESPQLRVKGWDKIEWTGKKAVALQQASDAGIPVEDLGNPFAFYITASPRMIERFVNSGDVGRLLLAQPDAPFPSLPQGITSDQLLGLYTETLLALLTRPGSAAGFIAVDTRTLAGLSPAQKGMLIDRVKQVTGRPVVEGGGEVLAAAGLAKPSAVGDVLEYVGTPSQLGQLVYLSKTFAGTPIPKGQITVDSFSAALGALLLSFEIVVDETGYHPGEIVMFAEA